MFKSPNDSFFKMKPTWATFLQGSFSSQAGILSPSVACTSQSHFLLEDQIKESAAVTYRVRAPTGTAWLSVPSGDEHAASAAQMTENLEGMGDRTG